MPNPWVARTNGVRLTRGGFAVSTGPRRIALLIDADNAPAAKIDKILADVAMRGSVTVRRAYGDWERPNLKSWKAVLQTHAIQPEQQRAYTPGKNATDMAMVIGAMDLLHDKSVDAYALVSSDADFTPLVTRLRGAGHKVHGFGEKKTPIAFRQACTTFTLVDATVKRSTQLKQLVTRATGATKHTPRASTEKLRGDARLLQRLRDAVDATKAKSGWSNLGKVRDQIGLESFDQRTYGYRRFGDFMLATDLFEIRRVGAGAQVRVKPRS